MDRCHTYYYHANVSFQFDANVTCAQISSRYVYANDQLGDLVVMYHVSLLFLHIVVTWIQLSSGAKTVWMMW